ncbi:MAG: Hsp20/alpha crystallin family protein [Candidatus Lokiarchaeota archaeon]|nr:Hsp20/alpha crystallin family protein [Candidatus Lokiarchaeota archaeon]
MPIKTNHDKSVEEIKKVDVHASDTKDTRMAERRGRAQLGFLDAIDSLFSRSLSDWLYSPIDDVMAIGLPGYRMPAMDIEESGDEYKVHAELPGIAKEEVKVEIEGGVLRISAEKKEEIENKEKHFFRKERYQESFHREICLPEDVDLSKDVNATLADGMLAITIKRVPPAPVEKKEIKVQ